MAGLIGMDKHGWCAGRGQGGGNLAPDMTRLTHPRQDHPALGGENRLDRIDKGLTKLVGHLV